MRMSPQGKGLRCEGSQPRRLKGMASLAVVWGWYIYICVCVCPLLCMCACVCTCIHLYAHMKIHMGLHSRAATT